MPVRNAEAVWNGSLKEGAGAIKLGSEAFEAAYSFGTRFEEAPGTNPEELLGAAHSACFSMALSAGLGKAGYNPARVRTQAKVHLEKQGDGFAVTRIDLRTEASVPGIDDAEFQKHAEQAKSGCPVSKALSATQITLDAKLV